MLEPGARQARERIQIGRVVAGVEPASSTGLLDQCTDRRALVGLDRRADLEHFAAPARDEAFVASFRGDLLQQAGGSLANVGGGQALTIFGVGALVTLSAAIVSLLGLRLFAKADPIAAIGATTGLQTQPANLAAAHELVGRREEIYVAYAITYPVAMIGKILIAQLLAAM